LGSYLDAVFSRAGPGAVQYAPGSQWTVREHLVELCSVSLLSLKHCFDEPG
jgi:hypothetical protein